VLQSFGPSRSHDLAGDLAASGGVREFRLSPSRA
jgi:hypothetical protein